MRQETINKWINIFKQYKPDMKVEQFCRQIGFSRASFYAKKRYFMEHPELAKYVQFNSDVRDCGKDNDDSLVSADHECGTGNDESKEENAPAIVPLVVAPGDILNEDRNATAADYVDANYSDGFRSTLEISVGSIRQRCSTAISEGDLAKLIKVCEAA